MEASSDQKKPDRNGIPTPREICKVLDDYVIGEEAGASLYLDFSTLARREAAAAPSSA